MCVCVCVCVCVCAREHAWVEGAQALECTKKQWSVITHLKTMFQATKSYQLEFSAFLPIYLLLLPSLGNGVGRAGLHLTDTLLLKFPHPDCLVGCILSHFYISCSSNISCGMKRSHTLTIPTCLGSNWPTSLLVPVNNAKDNYNDCHCSSNQ